MIMGGSFISTGDEASLWARFHFRPHFFQHAGFRLVGSDDGDPSCDAVKLTTATHNVYESQQLVNEYMLLHYGTAADAMPYADACALPAELVGFDAVLLANLLDRLPSPKACLARMGGYLGLVRPGGVLVVMSPYTWLEQFTPVDAWLGGYERDGKALSSKDGIWAALGEAFELVTEKNMPLLIREHVRKYQYIVTHVTVWRRKET